MYRPTTSFLTALLAILFAFGALVSVRWPSLIMAGGLVGTGDVASGLADVNWRQLGVTYGGPYFLAALCFYFSALATYNRRHGAFTWFVFACAAGFPVAFFVDFEAGWWRELSLTELCVLNAAALSILLAWAVWDLRQRRNIAAEPAYHHEHEEEYELEDFIEEIEPEPAPVRPARRRGPMPAAIMRQRQMFAAQGRKQLARQRKRHRR